MNFIYEMDALQHTPLDRLRIKRRQLAERIKQLEVRVKQKQGKDDTRREVLLGAMLMHRMQDNAE